METTLEPCTASHQLSEVKHAPAAPGIEPGTSASLCRGGGPVGDRTHDHNTPALVMKLRSSCPPICARPARPLRCLVRCRGTAHHLRQVRHISWLLSRKRSGFPSENDQLASRRRASMTVKQTGSGRNRNRTAVPVFFSRTRWTRTRGSSAFLENPLDPNPRFQRFLENPLDPNPRFHG